MCISDRNNTSIRNFRHDMKNHLYAIASMISDDNEEAKKYLTKMCIRDRGADAEVDRICHNKMFCNLYRRLKGRAVEL